MKRFSADNQSLTASVLAQTNRYLVGDVITEQNFSAVRMHLLLYVV